MLFKEYQPAAALQEWVECYWKFVMPAPSGAPCTPVLHVFPPEGSCSLVFIKVPALPFQGIHFVGPSTRVQQLQVFPGSVSLGIRLKPGYSGCLHAVDPASILNGGIAIEKPAAWQQELLNCITTDFDAPHLLDEQLQRYALPLTAQPDERVAKAVNIIIKKAGDISIAELSKHCFIGERQLQRLFTKHTGVTIKRFCQIRRLRQAIIHLYVRRGSCTEMASELGFTDPAHFYKSFRNIGAYQLEPFLKHIHQIDHQLL